MRAWLLVAAIVVGGCNQILGGEITGSHDSGDASIATDGVAEPGTDGGHPGMDRADGGVAEACAWSAAFQVGVRVDAVADKQDGMSISVSASGVAHVTYASNLDTIHRARTAGGQWSAPVTWSGFTRGLIAVDSADALHVFFGENSYTYRPAGGAWSPAVSGPAFSPCRSLAVGPSGPVAFGAWNRITWGAPGSSWISAQPEIGGECHVPSIALPANGELHFLAQGYYVGETLNHMVRSQGGTWTKTQLEWETSTRFAHRAIAVDSTGAAHFVFDKGLPGSRVLTYRKRVGAMVSPPVEPEQGVFVSDVATVIDATDRLHILYHDTIDENLRYIRRSAAGVWSAPEVVNTPGTGGNHVKLVIDGTGRMHALWTDAQQRVLYASRCTSS